MEKIIGLCLLAILFASTVMATNYSRQADKTLVSPLNGLKVPFDGPNCVDAALLAFDPNFPIMHVDPPFAQNEILSTCFKEVASSEEADTVGYFDKDDHLIHFFVLFADGTAFSKNGLEGMYPYRITTEKDIFENYQSVLTIVRYYQWTHSDTCLATQFSKNFVLANPLLTQAAEAIRSSVLSSPKNLNTSYLELSKYSDSLTGSFPTAYLSRALISDALHLPQYKYDRLEEGRKNYWQGLSSGLTIPLSEVPKRIEELKQLYLFLLNILSEEGIDDKTIHQLNHTANFIFTTPETGPEVTPHLSCETTEKECSSLAEGVNKLILKMSTDGLSKSKDGMIINFKSRLLILNGHTYKLGNIYVDYANELDQVYGMTAPLEPRP